MTVMGPPWMADPWVPCWLSLQVDVTMVMGLVVATGAVGAKGQWKRWVISG